VSSNTTYSEIETLAIEWAPDHEKFLVAWSGEDVTAFFPAATGDQQLVGRFIDESGTGLGADFLITNDPNTYDNSMDLAYGDGVWAVVGNADDGAFPTVTIVSNDGGLSAEAPCQATPSSTGGASIAYNPAAESFLCAWKGTGSDVFYNLMDSTGALSEIADVQLDSDGTVSGKPRVESLGEYGWLFTWHGAGLRDVFGAQIDLTGTLVGEVEFASAGLNDSNIEKNFRPSLAFSPSTGQAYIVWPRNDSVTEETEVYSRAWYVTEPELADTGFDAVLPAAVGLALAALGVLALRRRSVA
jgi:LPXTG-motif cell wall-anchored protein